MAASLPVVGGVTAGGPVGGGPAMFWHRGGGTLAESKGADNHPAGV